MLSHFFSKKFKIYFIHHFLCSLQCVFTRMSFFSNSSEKCGVMLQLYTKLSMSCMDILLKIDDCEENITFQLTCSGFFPGQALQDLWWSNYHRDSFLSAYFHFAINTTAPYSYSIHLASDSDTSLHIYIEDEANWATWSTFEKYANRTHEQQAVKVPSLWRTSDLPRSMFSQNHNCNFQCSMNLKPQPHHTFNGSLQKAKRNAK